MLARCEQELSWQTMCYGAGGTNRSHCWRQLHLVALAMQQGEAIMEEPWLSQGRIEVMTIGQAGVAPSKVP